MLMKVGPGGHISLGEKYAGQLFEVIAHPGDRFELIPASANTSESVSGPEIIRASDGWVPPGGYAACNEWALANREALELYARENDEEGTAAEQLQRFLALNPDLVGEDHGET